MPMHNVMNEEKILKIPSFDQQTIVNNDEFLTPEEASTKLPQEIINNPTIKL